MEVALSLRHFDPFPLSLPIEVKWSVTAWCFGVEVRWAVEGQSCAGVGFTCVFHFFCFFRWASWCFRVLWGVLSDFRASGFCCGAPPCPPHAGFSGRGSCGVPTWLIYQVCRHGFAYLSRGCSLRAKFGLLCATGCSLIFALLIFSIVLPLRDFLDEAHVGYLRG